MPRAMNNHLERLQGWNGVEVTVLLPLPAKETILTIESSTTVKSVKEALALHLNLGKPELLGSCQLVQLVDGGVVVLKDSRSPSHGARDGHANAWNTTDMLDNMEGLPKPAWYEDIELLREVLSRCESWPRTTLPIFQESSSSFKTTTRGWPGTSSPHAGRHDHTTVEPGRTPWSGGQSEVGRRTFSKDKGNAQTTLP